MYEKFWYYALFIKDSDMIIIKELRGNSVCKLLVFVDKDCICCRALSFT